MSVKKVKGKGPCVLLPHAKPDGAHTLLPGNFHSLVHEAVAKSLALEALVQVDTLDLQGVRAVYVRLGSALVQFEVAGKLGVDQEKIEG